MSDAINPDHYKRLPAEAIEIIESAIQNAPDKIAAYNHGQQLKYDLRLFEKGKTLREYLIDQEKHCWYSDRLREHLRKLVEQEDKCEQRKASDLQSLKDHPFGRLKTAPLNSDRIPEGYRKLNDASEEPRQLGDLRWSVAEKRYIEISVDEIGYANRDNWAACRKVETVIKQSLKTEAPDGWRWLEVGEVIRKGDQGFEKGLFHAIEPIKLGMTLQAHWMPTIRRNRFEVGEKVVENIKQRIGVVKEKIGCVESPFEYRVEMLDTKGDRYFFQHHLAPYIEDAK